MNYHAPGWQARQAAGSNRLLPSLAFTSMIPASPPLPLSSCPLPTQNNGYCGEVSIQTLMLRYGAWIPQEVARAAGGE